MSDITDKETGMRRAPTVAENERLDAFHAARTPGATFDYHGWDVSFRGWRCAHDSVIEVGVWMGVKMAPRSTEVSQIAVATTLGWVGWVSALDFNFNASDFRRSLPAPFDKMSPLLMSNNERDALLMIVADRLLTYIRRISTGA